MYIHNTTPCPLCQLIDKSRGSTDAGCEETSHEAQLNSRDSSTRNQVMDMARVRSDLTVAGYPEATADQLRLATRLLRAVGFVITDMPRHLSEPLRPPPGFEALAPAGAPDAGAPEADAVVHLSGNDETDVPPPSPLPASPMMMMMMMMKYPVPSQTPAHLTPAHQRQTRMRPMSPPE